MARNPRHDGPVVGDQPDSPIPVDRRDVTGVDGQWRLGIDGGEGSQPVASVFLPDNRRTEPAQYMFLLDPDQRLPRIPYGGLVEAHGLVAKGERPTFTVDGITIR